MIMIMIMKMKMAMSMILSSIVIEVIGQFIIIIFFYQDILHKKNTQALFKYLNTPKKHNKA